MTKSLAERVEEANRLRAAAAPGPWRKSEYSCTVKGENFTIYDEGGHDDNDAAFIAASHDNVDTINDLWAEVQRLQGQLDALANAAVGFEDAFTEARDTVLNGRHSLEGVLDNDQTNAVLGVLDEMYDAAYAKPIPRDAGKE